MTMVAERPEAQSPPPEVANGWLLARAQMALDAHREGRLTFTSTWGVWDKRPDGQYALGGCALAALTVCDGPMVASLYGVSAGYSSGIGILDTLAKGGVSDREVGMIEASFEGFSSRDSLTSTERAAALRFYEAFPWYDKEARGLAILRNIVAHGGRFDPRAIAA